MGDLEANKQQVREMIDRVWSAGDLDSLADYWTETCVNHAAPGSPVGLAALRAYHEAFAGQLDGFAEMVVTVVQQVAEGDLVVTHLLTTARHTGAFAGVAATGRPAELASIRIDRLDGGKIAEHWSVADVAGLVQQLQAQ